MRGLTILVVSADPARYRAALELAAAQAALGGRARVHLQDEAVALLSAEQPNLLALRTEAAALGATFSACQTGLAETGASLPVEVEGGGLIGLLTMLADDRLIVF